MAQILKLARAWDSGQGVLSPGEYAIPAEISKTLAKCARADGAGQIVTAKKRGRPRKEPAPENKLADAPPENKAPETED